MECTSVCEYPSQGVVVKCVRTHDDWNHLYETVAQAAERIVRDALDLPTSQDVSCRWHVRAWRVLVDGHPLSDSDMVRLVERTRITAPRFMVAGYGAAMWGAPEAYGRTLAAHCDPTPWEDMSETVRQLWEQRATRLRKRWASPSAELHRGVRELTALLDMEPEWSTGAGLTSTHVAANVIKRLQADAERAMSERDDLKKELVRSQWRETTNFADLRRACVEFNAVWDEVRHEPECTGAAGPADVVVAVIKRLRRDVADWTMATKSAMAAARDAQDIARLAFAQRDAANRNVALLSDVVRRKVEWIDCALDAITKAQRLIEDWERHPRYIGSAMFDLRAALEKVK